MENDYPYEIDSTSYKRFHEKNTIFKRSGWDASLPTHGAGMNDNMRAHIESGKEGYSRMDFALVHGGWSVRRNLKNKYSWEDVSGNSAEQPFIPEDGESFTTHIKKAGRFYGAALVGIAPVREEWIYQTRCIRSRDAEQSKDTFRDEPLNLPDGITCTIVIGVEMDALALASAPAQPAAAAASIGYSKMAFVLSCMSEFIQHLAYRVFPCGNDTALSIPQAIDAGLGALGRSGLLITPEYGSRIRICKMFTDMPLVLDRPDTAFINKVNKVCRKCGICAEACEAGAISSEEEPGFEGFTISNNPGVKKYYVDAEKCHQFWVKNSSDCGTCIAVCPFSSIKKLHSAHDFWET